MKNIQAFILAGGKSSRMGSEKGLSVLHGKYFVEHIISALRQVTGEISIVSNSHLYDFTGLPVYEDIVKGNGPLGGIYTGLEKAKNEWGVFVSCDVPFVHPDIIRYLLLFAGDDVVAVAPSHNGNIEPLCGIYNKKCASLFLRMINEGQLSLHGALASINARIVEISNEKFFEERMLWNINTPAELKTAREGCMK